MTSRNVKISVCSRGGWGVKNKIYVIFFLQTCHPKNVTEPQKRHVSALPWWPRAIDKPASAISVARRFALRLTANRVNFPLVASAEPTPAAASAADDSDDDRLERWRPTVHKDGAQKWQKISRGFGVVPQDKGGSRGMGYLPKQLPSDMSIRRHNYILNIKTELMNDILLCDYF